MNKTSVKQDDWSRDLLHFFVEQHIRIFPYVPDAGNARLIALADEHPDTRTVLLTTEEEGVGICAGADLASVRAALIVQSSGVGNCLNLFSLIKAGRFPFLLVVTMRGDYGERNPWQYPMGQAVLPALAAMGFLAFVVGERDELLKAADAAVAASFVGGNPTALILSQRFLGAKTL